MSGSGKKSSSGLLKFEIIPGFALGDFQLGMPISKAVEITNNLSDFLNRVDIIYCANEPLVNPITIKFDQGVKLQFNSTTQLLERIEVYNTAPIKLLYNGKEFSSPELCPSYHSLVSAFGPVHPGIYEKEKGEYMINYEGLALIFEIPELFRENCTEDDGILIPQCQNSPLVKLAIEPEQNGTVLEPLLPLEAVVGKGIKVGEEEIEFGDSPQDVVAKIGSPDVTPFTKSHDLMRKVHSDNNVEDYFYNYFQLGFDLLFDGFSHKLTKIVFHTNFPSHFLFNCYTKCPFRISLPEELLKDSPKLLLPQGKKKAKKVKKKEKNAKPLHISGLVDSSEEEEVQEKEEEVWEEEKEEEELNQQFFITSESSWDAVQAFLGVDNSPMISNTAAGHTKMYGFEGIAFEVLKNGFLATVVLCKI